MSINYNDPLSKVPQTSQQGSLWNLVSLAVSSYLFSPCIQCFHPPPLYSTLRLANLLSLFKDLKGQTFGPF